MISVCGIQYFESPWSFVQIRAWIHAETGLQQIKFILGRYRFSGAVIFFFFLFFKKRKVSLSIKEPGLSGQSPCSEHGFHGVLVQPLGR